MRRRGKRQAREKVTGKVRFGTAGRVNGALLLSEMFALEFSLRSPQRALRCDPNRRFAAENPAIGSERSMARLGGLTCTPERALRRGATEDHLPSTKLDS